MRIKALRQARIDAAKAHEGLLARHLAACQADNRGFTLTEKEEHREAEGKVKELDEQIAAEEQRIELEKASISPVVFGGRDRGLIGGPQGERGTFARAVASLFPGVAPVAENSASLAELVRATIAGDFSSRVVMSGQSETISSEGGFAAAPEISRRFWEGAAVESIALSRFRVEAMPSSEKICPLLDDFDRSSEAVADVEGQWAGEGATIDADVVKLAKVHLHARKAAVLVEIPRELLDDAQGNDLAVEFSRAMRDALTLKLDMACLNNGTGAGQPLSILNSGALVSTTRTTAGAVKYADILAMMARLPAESQGRFIWVASFSVLPSLFTLGYSIGTAGAAPPVFNQTAGGYSLLGRPLVFTPRLPSLGTVGDIIAVDPSQYVVGLRAPVQIAKSEHVAFARNAITLRALIRVDGMPAWAKARTDEDSVTRSPFVAIAT